jgi:uncharacterized protein (DUF433 family)
MRRPRRRGQDEGRGGVGVQPYNSSVMPDRLNGRIVRDRQICNGEPVFKGTRVTLRTVLASLAEGDNAEKILADFPSLSPQDIQAAVGLAT